MNKNRQTFNPYAPNYWETNYPKPERYKEQWSDAGASDEVYSEEERKRWKQNLNS
jgi:hypothetical protein